MNPAPKRQVYSLTVGKDVHRLTGQLRLIGGLIILALIIVIVGALTGIVVRILNPRAGGTSMVLISGLFAVATLFGGAAVIEAANRRAKKAEEMSDSIALFRTGCAISSVLNFLAGLWGVVSIFSNGLGNGLWLPQILVVAVSVIGMFLSIPRLKHISKLHYSPSLPCSRI